MSFIHRLLSDDICEQDGDVEMEDSRKGSGHDEEGPRRKKAPVSWPFVHDPLPGAALHLLLRLPLVLLPFRCLFTIIRQVSWEQKTIIIRQAPLPLHSPEIQRKRLTSSDRLLDSRYRVAAWRPFMTGLTPIKWQQPFGTKFSHEVKEQAWCPFIGA